ncbi:MAG: sulfurtransferase [Gemmatimonadetes bacterium]|nr:sulfurtransferase [Gemmatimonadota bacterium]
MRDPINPSGQNTPGAEKSPISSGASADGAGDSSAPSTTGWTGVRPLHPAVLASRLADGDRITIVDVREPWEWETARLDGARDIPLGEFAQAIGSLEREDEIVVYCHHGVRSLAAARYLADQGFTRLWNLSGGIDRYSREVDPAIPQY